MKPEQADRPDYLKTPLQQLLPRLRRAAPYLCAAIVLLFLYAGLVLFSLIRQVDRENAYSLAMGRGSPCEVVSAQVRRSWLGALGDKDLSTPRFVVSVTFNTDGADQRTTIFTDEPVDPERLELVAYQQRFYIRGSAPQEAPGWSLLRRVTGSLCALAGLAAAIRIGIFERMWSGAALLVDDHQPHWEADSILVHREVRVTASACPRMSVRGSDIRLSRCT